MRVEFEFDNSKVNALGYTMEQIKTIIKQNFQEYNLPCIFDDNVMVFSDSGAEKDFSDMWILVDRLVNSSWFLPCASACRWFNEDTDDEVPEDILSQAYLLVDKKA